MAKKLKTFATYGGKRYIRDVNLFKTKAEAQKYAKKFREELNNCAMIDKNKGGWFLWLRGTSKSPPKKGKGKPWAFPIESKPKSKPKPKTKPKATSTRFKGGIHHRNRSDAQSEMISWKKKGYSAEIRQARIAGELTYRVYKKPILKSTETKFEKIKKEINKLYLEKKENSDSIFKYYDEMDKLPMRRRGTYMRNIERFEQNIDRINKQIIRKEKEIGIHW